MGCYKCKHREDIPGDTHSRCQHPDLQEATNDPLDIQAISDKFELQVIFRAIQEGWFNWPWNFDPVWLENCDAFEEKNESTIS